MKRGRGILFGLGVLAAIAAAAHFLHLAERTVAFIAWIRGLGIAGAGIYAVVYVIGTVGMISGTALALVAGFLYGPVFGMLLVSPASVAGATISFLLARRFMRGSVERRIEKHPRFVIVDRAVRQQGFKVVLLMRLDPVFLPFAPLNYALGLTSIRLRDYLLSSWIGMLPASILYVYIGSVTGDIAKLFRRGPMSTGPWHKLLFWGGLVIAGILVALLTRIARQALRRELGVPEPNSARAKEKR